MSQPSSRFPFVPSVIAAAALGGVGLLLRQAVWQSAYDAESKLIVQPRWLLAFNAFCVLVGALIGLVYYMRSPGKRDFAPPYADRSPVTVLLRLLSAGCSAGAGVLLLRERLQTSTPAAPVSMVSAVLLILLFPTLALLTLRLQKDGLAHATALLLPLFAHCLWLVTMYQYVGGEPSPQVYLWPVVSGILVVVSWLGYVGFAYQRQSGRGFGLAAHLLLMAVPIAMDAPLNLPWRLSLAAPWLWMLAALLNLGTADSEPNQTFQSRPPAKPEA